MMCRPEAPRAQRDRAAYWAAPAKTRPDMRTVSVTVRPVSRAITPKTVP